MALSDNTIDNLIQIMVDRQEDINNYILEIIANRIREIGHLNQSDLYKLDRLVKMGADIRRINQELARLTGLQEAEIKHIIKEIALASYIDARAFYDYRALSFIPFEQNVGLQKVVNSIAQQTINTYRNLSNSSAFMIRDMKNPRILRPTSIARTYQSVIDEAVQAVAGGVVDYSTAMRRTMKQLNESGIRSVSYSTETGRRYTQRLDTAVRRNMLDAVRQLNQEMQDEIGRQVNADGKELSVHMNPAPDHQEVQGHVFTNEEYDRLQNVETFEDINGRKYSPIERHIGHWNCRHFAYSVIIGVNKPNYTEEQLQEIINRNEKGYTTPDGKHMTMYECTQYQRQLETKVRHAKDGQIMAKEAGEMDLAREYQREINKYTNIYESFSKACGLSMKKSKMSVSGYRKISA